MHGQLYLISLNICFVPISLIWLPHGPFHCREWMVSGETRHIYSFNSYWKSMDYCNCPFFHGPLQNTHHSSIWVAHIHSFISVGGRKLYYLDFYRLEINGSLSEQSLAFRSLVFWAHCSLLLWEELKIHISVNLC